MSCIKLMKQPMKYIYFKTVPCIESRNLKIIKQRIKKSEHISVFFLSISELHQVYKIIGKSIMLTRQTSGGVTSVDSEIKQVDFLHKKGYWFLVILNSYSELIKPCYI